jgi:multiple sugar transport system substrate-binding protein
MVLSSRRSTPTFRTIQRFDWDVAPLPQHSEQAGILHSDAYCLTKASDNKDAAWSFMEYALGPEGAPVVAKSGRTVPSLKSVAESEAFLDPTAKPANSQVFLDTIPVIQQVPSISTWPEIEDAAEPILEEGYYKGEVADEVARELRAATDDLFARAEG